MEEIKRGQIWRHPQGYHLKVVAYDDTSRKWLMKVCGQCYHFYALPATIRAWTKIK